MVSLSTWFRYAAHKFEYSLSLSWKKYNVGQINSTELTDAIWKNFFQGKLTFTHWTKGGEAMVPIVSPAGGTLDRKLAKLSPPSLVLLKTDRAFFSNATPSDPKHIEEPFNVEEAETEKVSPPSPDKLLVLGGSGFVGSHICKEALDRGFVVSSLNRSGKSSISESWADKVIWNQGNLLEPASLKDAMDDVSAVVSCVGGFGSNSFMYKVNGTANINAIKAAAEKGVKRFVYISAADFGLVNYLLQGYYDGKRAAEAELLSKFTYGGVILRPGFIYGTRRVGSVNIPLGLLGSPMQMVLQNAKPLTRLPLVGPLLTPPVSVSSVAKVAVRAATDLVFPPGVVDVHGIMRYSEQK